MCIVGARWVQNEILERYPNEDLRVYAVWFNMIASDSRSRWRWTGGVIGDRRVIHLWDEQKTVGRWFARNYDPNTEVMWDVFFLFNGDAQWQERPAPMVITGRTIMDDRDELAKAMSELTSK